MSTRSLLALVAVGFAIGLACRVDYHCEVDDECVTDDQPGTCEAEGWCSYADATCDSGRRWGPQAGAHADECRPRDEGSSDDSSSG